MGFVTTRTVTRRVNSMWTKGGKNSRESGSEGSFRGKKRKGKVNFGTWAQRLRGV